MASNVERKKQISPCSLSLNDIEKLFKRLSICVESAAKAEMAIHQKPKDIDADEHEKFLSHIKASHALSVVIRGRDGEVFVDHGNDNAFSSPNLPTRITNIYFDSRPAFKTRNNNRDPFNWLVINLDFTQPPLMDWSNPVSAPTINASEVTVYGSDENWVAGVMDIVNRTVDQEVSSWRRFIHRSFIYDIGLLLFGAPLAFYLCYLASPLIQNSFLSRHSILTGAGYIYSFFIGVMLYRILFGYTRWAFPKVELIGHGGNAAKHRTLWGALIFAILAGIVSTYLYENLKR
ncbi:MAG: hypothetical protein ACK4NA_16830 [Alphaproteobacteria bacterium]